MDVKTKRTQPASRTISEITQQPGPAPAGDAEIDYSPKKMTPGETLIVTLKLGAAAGVVFGLLWLAHVKLEK